MDVGALVDLILFVPVRNAVGEEAGRVELDDRIDERVAFGLRQVRDIAANGLHGDFLHRAAR